MGTKISTRRMGSPRSLHPHPSFDTKEALSIRLPPFLTFVPIEPGGVPLSKTPAVMPDTMQQAIMAKFSGQTAEVYGRVPVSAPLICVAGRS